MKVAHVVPTLSIGGVREYIQQICKYLSNSVDNSIYVLFRNSARPLRPIANVKIRQLDFDVQEIDQEERIINNLVRLWKADGVEVVHSHHVYSDIYAFPASSLIEGIRTVRTLHGITQFSKEIESGPRQLRVDWSEEEIDRELAVERFCDVTICVCVYLREKLIRYGFSSQKIKVINNGVDVGSFNCRRAKPSLGTAPKDPRNSVVVGFLGRLDTCKNVTILPELALKLLNDPSSPKVHFIIKGEGPNYQQLHEKVTSYGLLDNFQFWPFSEEVNEFYRTIDILILPSLSEGLPFVILEAMACAIPVVATKVGGMPELVKSGREGYLFDPHSPEEAAKYILLLGNPLHRKRIGLAGQKRVAARGEAKDMAKAIYQIYSGSR